MLLLEYFWWEVKLESTNYLALKAWKDICEPKPLGGMRFKLFKDIDTSLLT